MTRLNVTELALNIPRAYRLSLHLQSGDTLGILGANGVGKTTLLHTLAALRSYEQGKISIEAENREKNLPEFTALELARTVGLLLQDLSFEFPASVEETVGLGAYPRKSDPKQERDADLAKILTQFELNQLKTRCVTQLSGGEKRRVQLAMLALQNPEIYLLDEPNNHLDLRHQLSVLSYFQRLNKILIMNLHDVNLAQRFCTHILLLNKNHCYFGTTELLNPEYLAKTFEHDFVHAEGLFPA